MRNFAGASPHILAVSPNGAVIHHAVAHSKVADVGTDSGNHAGNVHPWHNRKVEGAVLSGGA